MAKIQTGPPPFVPVKSHCTECVVETGHPEKKTVQEGLAPSITALIAKHKAGIPTQTSARVLETWYKNLDLEDVRQLAGEHAALKLQLEQRRDAAKKVFKEQAQLAESQHKELYQFMQEQKQAAQAGPKS